MKASSAILTKSTATTRNMLMHSPRELMRSPREMASAFSVAVPDRKNLEEQEMAHSDSDSESTSDEYFAEPLDGSVFALSVCSLVHDVHKLQTGTQHFCRRLFTVIWDILLMGLCLLLQGLLLISIAQLLALPAVQRTQKLYWEFEIKTHDAEHRFDMSRFRNLSSADKIDFCNITLAHPVFLGAMLYIWTLTVFADIKNIFDELYRLVVVTPTVPHMACTEAIDQGRSLMKVRGLTLFLKVVCVVVNGCRLTASVVLLWLGCRWLSATDPPSEVLLNAIALEFVLLLRSLLYTVLTPREGKRKVENTFFPLEERHKLCRGTMPIFWSIAWGISALIWVVIYLRGLQQVIPGYQWDLRTACRSEIHESWWMDLLEVPSFSFRHDHNRSSGLD